MINEKQIVKLLIKAKQTAHHAVRARKNLSSMGIKPQQQQSSDGR